MNKLENCTDILVELEKQLFLVSGDSSASEYASCYSMDMEGSCQSPWPLETKSESCEQRMTSIEDKLQRW